jgi:hypothetical protein
MQKIQIGIDSGGKDGSAPAAEIFLGGTDERRRVSPRFRKRESLAGQTGNGFEDLSLAPAASFF